MEREEAIRWLTNEKWTNANNKYKKEWNEALDMAIEALQTDPTKAVPPSLADVYKWERDIALLQLEEYGIGFAEKKRDDLVWVVRCKDCKYKCLYDYDDDEPEYYYCALEDRPNRNWSVDDTDYCSWGERREPCT